MNTTRIASTIALAALAGCASLDAMYERTHWQYDGIKTATYTWTVDPDAKPRCGQFAPNVGNWACAVRVEGAQPQPGAKPIPGATVATGHCFVYSNVPEEDARRIGTTDGDDLWSHEVYRHCRDGYKHPDRKAKTGPRVLSAGESYCTSSDPKVCAELFAMMAPLHTPEMNAIIRKAQCEAQAELCK